MAKDLMRMLTEITPTQQPVAVPGTPGFRGMFGQQQAQRLQGSLGSLARGGAPSAQARMGQALAGLDLNKPEDLAKLAKIQQGTGDFAGAAKTAAQIEALVQRDKEKDLLASQAIRRKDTRQAIADQVRAAGYTTMADAIVKEAGSGSQLALQGGIKVLTNLAQPPKEAPRTYPTPEEKMKVFRMEESFKADLEIANKAEQTAAEQSAQYLPILEQMGALTDTVDFGVGSTTIADINNTLHSLASKAGLNPKPLDPNVDATATYNSLSKRLKAWLLEAQKGAISNLENREITKNTANPDMTKNQAKALVNYSQASLMSANNKAQEQKQWLRDNGTLIGFEKAWGKYIEDFPRTEGFLTVKDLDGKTDSIQANFKPIRSNMELFSLYANKKGKPPTFVSKEGKGITLENVKKEIIQDQIDELKKGNPNFKPTKEQLSLYELNARRKIGQLISLRLNNGTYTVTK